MKKLLLIAIASISLLGCNPYTEETTANYVIPSGLEGCKVFRMGTGGLSSELYVVRCPETTSTHWSVSTGKSSTHYNTTADNFDPNSETLDQSIERLNTALAELYRQKAMQ